MPESHQPTAPFSRLWERMIEHLRTLDGILVAFSGGSDSALLLDAALAAGIFAESATAQSQFHSRLDQEYVSESVRTLPQHVHHQLYVDLLGDRIIHANPARRCYHCKRRIFSALIDLASDRNLQFVVDGTHAEDDATDRPGMLALNELGVLSPFQELGLSKRDIHGLLRWRGRPEWQRPSNSCLATRVHTGVSLDSILLERVEDTEAKLHAMGLRVLRVRTDGRIATLELGLDEQEHFASPEVREAVERIFETAGFERLAEVRRRR